MKEFAGTKKHKGNWQVNLNNHTNQILIENVCIIDEGWSTPLVPEDAMLISHAPDIYEAARQLVIELDKYCDMRYADKTEILRDILTLSTTVPTI